MAEKNYEAIDVQPRAVGLFAVSLIALTIFTLLVMGWLLRVFSPAAAKAPNLIAVESEKLRPGPKLQVSPARDLKEMRAMEDHLLNSYRWVDAEAGIVSMPVERAMDLIAARGLPVHPSVNPSKRED